MSACQAVVRIRQDLDGMHVGEDECGLPGEVFTCGTWFCRACALDMAKEGDILPPELEAVVLVLAL